MIPGIKMDKGYDKAGLPGTQDGPLGHAETWCKGIDDLDKRCAEAYAQGARFAKWRNVLQIDPAKGIPSDFAIDVCVKNLAQYAAICQKNGLVPIVEPEIVPNGSHPVEVHPRPHLHPPPHLRPPPRLRASTPPPSSSPSPLHRILTPRLTLHSLTPSLPHPPYPPLLCPTPRSTFSPFSTLAPRQVCAEITERVLVAQYAALKMHNVYLEGSVLKPNMVKNGLEGPKATPERISELTIAVLKRTVPAAVPGIFFLSVRHATHPWLGVAPRAALVPAPLFHRHPPH